jgi:hypothetical protein
MGAAVAGGVGSAIVAKRGAIRDLVRRRPSPALGRR